MEETYLLEYINNNYYLDDKILDHSNSLKIRNHSPDGFNHGYNGSGPTQLSVAILDELDIDMKYIKYFRETIIAPLPQNVNYFNCIFSVFSTIRDGLIVKLITLKTTKE